MVFTETFNLENINDSAIKIGNALIDSDYYLKIADESVYRFLGEFAIFPIVKNIHPDDKELFINKINSLRVGERDFIILKFRNTSGIPRSTNLDEDYVISEDQYITAIIFMEKGFASAKNLDFVNIEIYHILYLRKCAKKLDSVIERYTSLLKLSEDLYFEYRASSNDIYVFRFKDAQEEFRYKGSLEGFAKKLAEGNYDNEHNLKIINNLISDIENFSNNFFYIFETNVLSKTGVVEKINVKGITINKDKTDKVAIGIIKNSGSISSSDVEFLKNQVNLDSLTGLLNKKAITDAINLKFKVPSVKTLSLVMMDIDYFKDINDSYGHMFGDEVLITVANTLKEIVGERGIIGRVGGDEFLIAIENLNDLNELRSVLKAIRSKIEWAYSGQIKITTSLGCATYPKDADNYETLLKLSDKCLYIAKEKGRNRFIIYNKEVHGGLSSVDLSSRAISMIPKISVAEKSENICEIIGILSRNGSILNNVVEAAESLKDYYSFDKCMIFFGNDEIKHIYSLNAKKKDLELISLLDGYKDIFSDKNILSIGNYISVETKNVDLYKFLCDTKNYSAIQYLIKDDGLIKGLISISTYNRTNKWSELDTNYLTIIFNLISKALLRSY